jgi:ATP-dependent RNA helicase RhlE
MSEPEENAHIKNIERLSKKRIDVVNDHPFPQTDKPMTEVEKKEWNKEKQRRKQEFFANRKKNREGGASNTNKNRNQGRSRGRR